MRLCLLVLSSALIAPCLPAQTLPAELRARSIQLLESSSLSDKAWGVHLIASLHLTDLQDRLIAELRACQDLLAAAIDGPEYAYVQTLLDALIQMDVTVPPDLILPFRRGHRAEGTILLLRKSATEDLLFEMLDRAINDTEWLAIANTLVERRSSRILDRLLDGLPITHSFHFVGGSGSLSVEGGRPDGSGAVIRTRRLAKGFPPTGVYTLSRFASSPSALLAPGPKNVYYRRTVVAGDGVIGWSEGGPDAAYTKRIDLRLQLIAARSGYSEELVYKVFRPSSELASHTPARFDRDLSRRLDEQTAALRDFLSHTKRFGATTMKHFRVEILPELHDFRKNKSAKLPTPTPRVVEIDMP